MAEAPKSRSQDEVLKALHQKASEAEDRLAKLETLLVKSKIAGKRGDNNVESEVSYIITDFQSKLEIAQAEHMSEKEKASLEIKRLVAENQKLQNRVLHLTRALREADSKLASCTAN